MKFPNWGIGWANFTGHKTRAASRADMRLFGGSAPSTRSHRRPMSSLDMTPGDRATIRCEGDLDIVTAEEVKQRLATAVESSAGIVTLDLRDVGFVDSSGLGALVAVHHYARANGANLVVRSAPDHVRNLFSLTRLDDLLTVE
jgi:anti-sigma B factor antagonist